MTFPKLADTLVEGVVSAWYKRPGETVRRGEPLFAVETDKVNTDVDSPHDGVLAEILVAAGEHADVGQTLARLSAPGTEGEAESGDGKSKSAHGGAVRMIFGRDQTPEQIAATLNAARLTPMRRRIAERMSEARATIAQGSCARQVDVRAIVRGERSWTAYFVKALAEALGSDRIGVAVAIPGGLVVPVVPDARAASLDAISARIRDVAERARNGTLEAGDVGGAAASVTNVGATGTLLAFPLVAPGERAILAPGAIVEGRCWVALCYDRAQLDEYAADRVLASVCERLQEMR
ncbi:MAG: 2-oxo acid dehydrogenase subunit E2 [Candidatus Eremiobacteraeota bacterium]|nr:2-oxo acid dehydrogenase subunit E2 [Candidatus Eremiobacteraeota bacterium]